ncbi:LOW QUALITY PROTEIN: protein odr-4 homolog [Homalodisca vitripennis]|uniref:LOW QUALITY PROTEIN: protein odr-4 homolog n=1 Tax=Homalodisca vitripennis TaxID=197043 RepID=UPI001EEA67CD|nr:LOW QUALITY PROTEIN: protein odr-4 homolog [Homalodisca vitripennis]
MEKMMKSGDGKKNQKKSLENLSDIKESWIVDHAKQVTRMLPGGLWVLGLFVTGTGDVLSNSASQSKVTSLLQGLTKALEKNPNLLGNSPSTEKLALHLVSGTNKVTCMSYDVTKTTSPLRATDFKFTNLKWLQLDSQYDCDLLPPLLITDQLTNNPLRKHLQNILEMVIRGVQKSLCVIDGEVRQDDEALDKTDSSKCSKADKKAQESKIYQVNLYIPNELGDIDETVSSVLGEMKCTGVLASRVFVHQKATVAEASQAVKEDIIRSFAARLEMHWDSLVEEEIGSPEETIVVHEPPRRVLIPLPYSKVALSDYLFPGEGPSEALVSILDLIGVKVSESAVYKDFEGQPDQCDLYNLTTNVDPPKNEDISVSPPSHSLFLLSGIAIAFVILLVSLFIQFYIK